MKINQNQHAGISYEVELSELKNLSRYYYFESNDPPDTNLPVIKYFTKNWTEEEWELYNQRYRDGVTLPYYFREK